MKGRMIMSKHTLDEIRQKIEKDREKDAQRAADLDNLRDQIAGLDEKINAALNRDQTDAAELMIEEQNELKKKIPTLQRIAEYKSRPDAYREEVTEICKANVAAVQPKADKIIAELGKAYQTYLEKKVALVKLLHDATEFRCECGVLAGYDDMTNCPLPCVAYDNQHTFVDKEYGEANILREMDQAYHAMLNNVRCYGTAE